MTDAVSLEGFRPTGGVADAGTAARRPLLGAYRPGSSRTVGIAAVVLIHVAVLYALYVSLGTRAARIVHQPIQVSRIEEVQRTETVPPPPPPEFKPLPPYVPPPEINVAAAPAPASTAITAVTTAKPVEAPPPAPQAAPVKRVPPDIDVRHSTDPVYPPDSRRRGEEGLVVLLVLVEADGQPSEVKLERSSGHDRLDQAALEGARHGLRYVAGTVDGKAERMWLRYRYNFQLR